MAEKNGGDDDPCMSKDGPAGSGWWGADAPAKRRADGATEKPLSRDAGPLRKGYVRTNLGRILRNTEPMRKSEYAVSACDDGGAWRDA